MTMPKIGLRNLKTTLAVFVTLLVYLTLYMISPSFASTWYSPFFAGIAAVYSMQRENAKSFALARIRSFGSLFGGLFGMFLVLLYESLLQDYVINQFGQVGNLVALYLLTTVFIMILIAFLVQFKKQDLVFVAALTYLSVTISLRNNLPVVPFAINRISSTIIGVLITLMINQINWHKYRNQDILFVSGLDQCILTREKKLTSYSQFTLTNLINDGLNFTLSTTRTPASLTQIFQGIPLNLELMIMNGAVTYDITKEKYLDIKYISKKAQLGIDRYFSSINRNVFTYSIVDQALSIYHTQFANEAEEKYYSDRKNDYFRNHVKGRLHEEENAVFYIVIDQREVVEKYASDLIKFYPHELSYQIYPYPFYSDYFFLKINTSQTSKEAALSNFLTKHNKPFVVAFGSMPFDVNIMKSAHFSCALKTADDEVKKVADMVIDSDHPDELIRLMKNIYFTKDYKTYLAKLKTMNQTKK
jgi:hydroxymethylpyrimidine pyrophosphatase-like HAD family hydrolase